MRHVNKTEFEIISFATTETDSLGEVLTSDDRDSLKIS
jgi:hypothetical protein